MFEFFRRHTRVLQFVLVLLIFPSFVFFGIQGYSRFSSGERQTVATVDGHDITQLELDNSLRERVEQARRQMPGIDPKVFESPEMRRLALDAMVRDRVLLVAADKQRLATTDDRLERLFKNDPQFAQLRNPDGSVNRDALAALGLSSQGFAERLRQDISRRQVMQGLAVSVIAPAAAASAALDALYQQREVQVQRFEPKTFLDKAQATEAEVESFYKDPAHAAQFEAPEEAKVDYVVLDLESLKKGATVPEADLRKYYSENEKRYTAPEERRASHILVKADKDAPKADRAKARAKAETLLAEVRKNPSGFADIAKKNSDDEGSAAKGGDLDYFARGAMVKPFEDATYALKPGEISDVVESDFGYHIIKLDDVRGGQKKSFDAVRNELENEVRNQLAQKRFAEAAVEFGDTVYEQSDSLEPVAKKWGLEVKQADHVKREPASGATGALASLKFHEALFSNDALKDKRNTKAIDIGANQLAAGRVVAYTPAHRLPLADVKDRIRQQLAARQAAAMASKAGVERLAAARAAPATTIADKPVVVSRAKPGDLPRALLDAILKAPAAKLPAFVGVDLESEGYAVAKITGLMGRDPSVADAGKGRDQYAQVYGDAEAQAYYAVLKDRYKVTIESPAGSRPDDVSGPAR